MAFNTETQSLMLARMFRAYADQLDSGELVCNLATIRRETAAFLDEADECPRAVQYIPTGARIITAKLMNHEEYNRCADTLARPGVVSMRPDIDELAKFETEEGDG